MLDECEASASGTANAPPPTDRWVSGPGWLSVPAAPRRVHPGLAGESRSRLVMILSEDAGTALARDVTRLDEPAARLIEMELIRAPAVRLSLGSSRRELGHRLDVHGLDRALSMGRHAAERAKLAGVERLQGVAMGDAPDRPPRQTDPYAWLLELGRADLAVMIGLTIAAAQMGLVVSLGGRAGALAQRMAITLNSGVSDWCVDGRRPVRRLARARDAASAGA